MDNLYANWTPEFQIGQSVAVNFGYAGSFGACTVTGIHLTREKIKYDLEVKFQYSETEEFTTRIYNIDSKFIVSRQEWLDWNQSRPSFGAKFFNEEMPLKN